MCTRAAQNTPALQPSLCCNQKPKTRSMTDDLGLGSVKTINLKDTTDISHASDKIYDSLMMDK